MQNKNNSPRIGDIEIIYEDDKVIVINKPAGLTMHPKNALDQSNSVQKIFSAKLANNDELRGGIVHRLDKDTSGVVIMAKDADTLEFLQSQFANRKVDKQYMCLVWGHLKHPRARIELPIRRSTKSPNIMAVHPTGKMSISEYRVVSEYPLYSYVEFDIHTGRTHQIRVQLAHLGHSVVGDKLYGGKSMPAGLTRQFLHAQKLSLIIPGQDTKTSFIADMPSDLSNFLEGL
ncbi:MAG: RNA pseudouridine synthase [Patescibacteria group bacterium]|jgi:23S rRNA pseudouridine1911/1915/1917 synthase|nr:RNA pseudouridine synthase [Patescibacteria group bacterium]